MNHLACNSHVFQRHVLTAAHCCDDHEARELRVVAGEHDLNSEDGLEQAVRVDEIQMHQDYNPDTIENDLCVLTLREELEFNRYYRAQIEVYPFMQLCPQLYVGPIMLSTRTVIVAVRA